MAKFEPDYSRRTQYTNEYPFSSIIFPAGAPLLGEDGNELQDIIDNKREEFTAEIMTDGFIADVGYEDITVNYDYYPLQSYLEVHAKGAIVINGNSYNIDLALEEESSKELWWYVKIENYIADSENLAYTARNRFDEEISKRACYKCSLEASETEPETAENICVLLHTKNRNVYYRNTGPKIKARQKAVIDNTTPANHFSLYETDYIQTGTKASEDGYFYLRENDKILRSKDKIEWEDMNFPAPDEGIISVFVSNNSKLVCTKKGIWSYYEKKWKKCDWDNSDISIRYVKRYECSNGKIILFIEDRPSTYTAHYYFTISLDNGGTWSNLYDFENISINALGVADDGVNAYITYYESLYVCKRIVAEDTFDTPPVWEKTNVEYRGYSSSSVNPILIANGKIFITTPWCRLYIYNPETFELLHEINLRYTSYGGSGTPFICGDYIYYAYAYAGYEIPIDDPENYKRLYYNSGMAYKYGSIDTYSFISNNPDLYDCENPIIVTNHGLSDGNSGITSYSIGRGRVYLKKKSGSWISIPVPSEYLRTEAAAISDNGVLCLALQRGDAGIIHVATLKYDSETDSYGWNITPIIMNAEDERNWSLYGTYFSIANNRICIPCSSNNDIKTVLVSNEI